MATTQNNNNAVQHNQFTGTTTTPSMTSSKRKKRSGFKKLFRFGKRGKKKEGDEQSFFDASVIAEEPTPHEHQQWMTPKNFDPTAVPKDGSSFRQSAKSKPKRSSSRPPPPSMPKSWLARTSFFKNMVDNAFAAIDADGSGDIDEKELYSGLLLIHLQLGAYAGPAACKVRRGQQQKRIIGESLFVDGQSFYLLQSLLFTHHFVAYIQRKMPCCVFENGCGWIRTLR